LLPVTVWTEGFASITCQVSRTQRNLAQGIARAHRGRVQVDSAPGAGATVTLFLPLAARTSAGDPAIGRD